MALKGANSYFAVEGIIWLGKTCMAILIFLKSPSG